MLQLQDRAGKSIKVEESMKKIVVNSAPVGNKKRKTGQEYDANDKYPRTSGNSDFNSKKNQLPRMGYNDSQLTPSGTPIYGFNQVVCQVEGVILLVTIGEEPREATQMSNFQVFKASSTYNTIMGRTGIHIFKAVPLTYHMVLSIEDMNVRENEELWGKPSEGLIPIPLDPLDLDKVTYAGASLEKPLKGRLTTFLQENNDIFSWIAADMPRIDPDLTTHKLNVNPTRKVVKLKKRTYTYDKLEAIKQEVEKLLKAGFIKEVQFPEWLENPIMVKKANEKWRMCIDFINLRDTCPKD
ncbi:uncharacterized protein LOC141683811 [Apium graveolens]|uniref:uncharacterized protein LOC141683811 n=1 Tax=Apium graveolens TaxID=4045 RepID=UPI003D7AF813